MASNIQDVYTAPDPYFRLRKQMVEEQLQSRGVRDEGVLKAMLVVPRHRFVGEGNAELAYRDMPLALPCDQTVSQPYMVAKTTELLELQGDERVLEVGGGCGYQAAVLSCLSKQVFALEWHAELAALAIENLARNEFGNVEVHHADGKKGWAPSAPYDCIVVACSVREVPAIWEKELRPGGILVFPSAEMKEQRLCRWIKGNEGWKSKEDLFGVRYVPLL